MFESARNYQKIRLLKSEEIFRKLSARPSFHSFTILSNSTILCNIEQTTVHLNKPSYLGGIIMELAKYKMLEVRGRGGVGKLLDSRGIHSPYITEAFHIRVGTI